MPATRREISRQCIEIAQELTADIDRLDDQLKASKRRITDAVVPSGTSLISADLDQ
jgi:hypothetical protein